MAVLGAPKAHPRRMTAAGLWGDGFAGDSFEASRSMTKWDECSSDEYAMLYPKLVRADGLLPPALLGQLEICVAVRAWRLTWLDPAKPALDLRSGVLADAARYHGTWFADDGTVACLLRQMGLLRTSPERVASERLLLALLDDILFQVQLGLVPAWTEDRDAWFAFGSGIHPAYLWPESALAPARGCTAAWLGHLDRGRTALMPEPVADYLLDAVLDGTRARDRSLASMVGCAEDARRLHRAAIRRLAGNDPIVSFGRGRQRRVATAGNFRSTPPVREDAFEHA
ncbi:MAG: hypothetical protein ACRYGP_05405 [Janthinobacterium lividum]